MIILFAKAKSTLNTAASKNRHNRLHYNNGWNTPDSGWCYIKSNLSLKQ